MKTSIFSKFTNFITLKGLITCNLCSRNSINNILGNFLNKLGASFGHLVGSCCDLLQPSLMRT